MCTNWSTRNRAVVNNHYAVQTLLLNKDAYCPCGPNRQDYSYRSRLYNPDPKYQCHLDLTCHAFDSIPKATSCDGYGAPSIYTQTVGAGSSCMSGSSGSNTPRRAPRCKRRVIRPENCCVPKPDLCNLVTCCCEPAPCEEPCDEVTNIGSAPNDECCFELPTPQENCNDSVTYDCGPCGEVCSVQLPGGNNFEMPSSGRVCLETGRSGCDNPRIRITSCGPCCEPPSCGPCCVPLCVPCCPPPRRVMRCSTRNLCKKTTVGPSLGCGYQCLECRPRFRNPFSPEPQNSHFYIIMIRLNEEISSTSTKSLVSNNLSPKNSHLSFKEIPFSTNAIGKEKECECPSYNLPISSATNLFPEEHHGPTDHLPTPSGSRKSSRFRIPSTGQSLEDLLNSEYQHCTLDNEKSGSHNHIANIFPDQYVDTKYQLYQDANPPLNNFAEIVCQSNWSAPRCHPSARDDENNQRWKRRSHLHDKCSLQNIGRNPERIVDNESTSDAQCCYHSQCNEPPKMPTNKVRSRFTESSFTKSNYGSSCNYGVPPNVLQELADLQNSSQAPNKNGDGDKDVSPFGKVDEYGKVDCLDSMGLVRIPSALPNITQDSRVSSSRSSTLSNSRRHSQGLPFAETAWVIDTREINAIQQQRNGTQQCNDIYNNYSDSASYTNQPSYLKPMLKETLAAPSRKRQPIDFTRLENQRISEHQASYLPPRCNDLIQKAKRAHRLAMARKLYLNPEYGRPRWNTNPRPMPEEPYESLAAAEAKLSALDDGYYFPYENQPSVYTMVR
ncbi:unnamed protein product [Orchesella dallaii]|uniref:Uncharacterized protein n=1 Tax=Orchesella dallaii TaxID=48710 RepID=A0ABP1S154_9HEXA